MAFWVNSWCWSFCLKNTFVRKCWFIRKTELGNIQRIFYVILFQLVSVRCKVDVDTILHEVSHPWPGRQTYSSFTSSLLCYCCCCWSCCCCCCCQIMDRSASAFLVGSPVFYTPVAIIIDLVLFMVSSLLLRKAAICVRYQPAAVYFKNNS